MVLMDGRVVFRMDSAVDGTMSWVRSMFDDIKAAMPITLGLLLLAAFGVTSVYSKLPTNIANFIGSLRSGQLSRLDRATLERGYYEDLNRVGRFNNQLWQVYMKKPLDWLDVEGTGLTRFTGDFIQTDLVPSFRASTSWSDISTNRWGMRDRNYEKAPDPAVFRFALLGASLDMGWGVEDDETYESLAENMLNSELSRKTGVRYEILNFAVPGYFPLQQMASLDRALDFAPHVVIFVAHGLEQTRAAEYLVQVVRKGIDIPYPVLAEFARSAGLTRDTSQTIARRLLEPFAEDILEWTYRRVVEQCRERSIRPVLLMFERDTSGDRGARQIPMTLEIAARAGFTVIELEGVFQGYERAQVLLAEWDEHPNKLGHQLIARKLVQALREIPELAKSPIYIND